MTVKPAFYSIFDRSFWRLSLLLVLGVAAAYLPALQAHFVNFDDTRPGSTVGNEDDSIFTWDGTQFNASTFYTGFGWDAQVDLSIGKGFFISPASTQTITFVGEVQTGVTATTIAPGLTLLGNKIPVAGPVPGSSVGNDGDSIFTWDGSQWVPSGFIEDFGWDSGDVNGPAIGVADGFFYQNVGGSLNWTVTLNP